MSNKNKSAQGAKEVTPAQENGRVIVATIGNQPETKAAAEDLKGLIKAAGLESETKTEPPRLSLAERERAIRENADKLKGLTALRQELDMLRAWGFADNGTNATLRISGEENFTTSNTRLIAKLKSHLEELFEERIQEIETEIEKARI